jgi:hypothetical protein
METLFNLIPSSPAVMMRRIRSGIPAESFVETAEKLGL